MKKILFASILTITACATPTKKTEDGNASSAPSKAIEERPIEVLAPGEKLATIDQKTLKVTYEKGTDPKRVVDQLVKALANAMQESRACYAELEKVKK